MSFASELQAAGAEIRRRQAAIYFGVLSEMERSVTEGSEITGAPGQPVDTATLLNSWTNVQIEQWLNRVATNVGYAAAIEAGDRVDHERSAHTRQAHERGAHTRKDGTQVRRHSVSAHQVAAHSVRGGPITFRSPVGGAHSVKLTRAGFPRIVETVASQVLDGGAP